MLGATDRPHAKYPHVYAIVRFGSYMSGENAATVVKVLASRDLADQEAARLNELKKGKHSSYTVQVTRFVESVETGPDFDG